MASSGFGKQAIDERKLVPLLRNVHPLASPEFDLGPLRLTSPWTVCCLCSSAVRKREAALTKLLDEQEDKSTLLPPVVDTRPIRITRKAPETTQKKNCCNGRPC
jgi:hypothetical protein